MMPDEPRRDEARQRRVAVDLIELRAALEGPSWEPAWYLARETDQVGARAWPGWNPRASM
jgi:hypothetical protein